MVRKLAKKRLQFEAQFVFESESLTDLPRHLPVKGDRCDQLERFGELGAYLSGQ